MTTPGGMFTKNDYAYAELQRRILTGVLPAGAVIPQAKLAAEIGVSTTPLREAIRRLSAEGMVELEAHRDARVTPVSADEARHLYQVRENLDPLAAALAAQMRTASDIAAISAAFDRLSPIASASDLDALVRHREFHRTVYRASGNPVLIDILERLWDKADRYRVIGLSHRGDSPKTGRGSPPSTGRSWKPSPTATPTERTRSCVSTSATAWGAARSMASPRIRQPPDSPHQHFVRCGPRHGHKL